MLKIHLRKLASKNASISTAFVHTDVQFLALFSEAFLLPVKKKV
jgi:hypothetical protein